MQHILLYYFATIIPGIILGLQWDHLGNLAMPLLLIYVFIYRNLLDAWRLLAKGLILKNEAWKIAIPGMRGKYLRQLYLEK